MFPGFVQVVEISQFNPIRVTRDQYQPLAEHGAIISPESDGYPEVLIIKIVIITVSVIILVIGKVRVDNIYPGFRSLQTDYGRNIEFR